MSLRFFLSVLLFCVLSQSVVVAQEIPTSLAENLFLNQLRLQTFSDFSLPAIGMEGYVPTPDATKDRPMDVFNYAWLDGPLAGDYRWVYWQAFFLKMQASRFGKIDLANPRFALRRDNFFESGGKARSRLDLFYQPGWSALNPAPLLGQLGVRSDSSYRPESGGCWSFDLLAEATWNFYTASSLSSGYSMSTFSGMFFPTVQYRLSEKMGWSTGMAFFAKWRRVDQKWVLGAPPYLQNGLTWSVSQTVWVAGLVNHYLQVAPRLKNTWGSLWVSLKVL